MNHEFIDEDAYESGVVAGDLSTDNTDKADNVEVQLLTDEELSPEALAEVQRLNVEIEALEQAISDLDDEAKIHKEKLAPLEDEIRHCHDRIESIKAHALGFPPYKMSESDKQETRAWRIKMTMLVTRYKRELRDLDEFIVPINKRRFALSSQKGDLKRQIVQLRQK